MLPAGSCQYAHRCHGRCLVADAWTWLRPRWLMPGAMIRQSKARCGAWPARRAGQVPVRHSRTCRQTRPPQPRGELFSYTMAVITACILVSYITASSRKPLRSYYARQRYHFRRNGPSRLRLSDPEHVLTLSTRAPSVPFSPSAPASRCLSPSLRPQQPAPDARSSSASSRRIHLGIPARSAPAGLTSRWRVFGA